MTEVYQTDEALYTAIEEFAYTTYNHRRPHSYNNYKTPFEARKTAWCHLKKGHRHNRIFLALSVTKKLDHNKDTMYDVLQRNVEAVLTGTDGISLYEIDTRLEELQKELLNVANAKGNYDSIVDEIYRLREAKQNA